MAYKGFGALTKKRALLIAFAALAVIFIAFLYFNSNKSKNIEFGKNLLTGPKENIGAWQHDAYYNSEEISSYDINTDEKEPVFSIKNSSLNDARFYQTVAVSPNTFYLFEGDILAKAKDGRGANLSIKDVYSFSESLYDTKGEYEHVKLYGKTGPKQTSLTVYARLGGYSGESTGSASFKNLKLSAVKSVPGNESIQSFAPQMGQSEPSTQALSSAAPAYPLLILISLFFIIIYLFMIKKQGLTELSLSPEANSRALNYSLFFGLLAFSLLLRLYLAVKIRGYGVDIGCFTGWCSNLTQNGTSSFYQGEGHSDYPPGYMLVLLLLGNIARLFSLPINEFLVKIPPILADIAGIALIFKYAKTKSNEKAALILAFMYAINPLILLTGAGWGQVDSFTSLSLMMVVILSLEKKWSLVFPCFILSALLKPQALMFGPLGLLAIVLEIIWSDKKHRLSQLKSMLIGLILSLLVFFAVVIPFNAKGTTGFGLWVFELYQKTMNFYDRATVNNLNIYFLFGLNWQMVKELAPLNLKLTCLAIVSFSNLIMLYSNFTKGFKSRLKKISLISISAFNILALTISSILNVSLAFLGTLLMISCFLMLAFDYIDKKSIKNLPLFGALMLILFSFFGTMMHERYIYPALALLVLDFIINRDKKSLYLLLAISFTSFLNVGIVLDRGVRITGVEGHLTSPLFNITSDSTHIEYGLAFINTFLALAALTFNHTDAIKKLFSNLKSLKKHDSKKSASRAESIKIPPFEARRLDKKDAFIIIALTLCYAFLGLFKLGATSAPQNYWKSEGSDREIVFDLGEEREFKALIYPGIINKRYSHDQRFFFNLDTSSDSKNWNENRALLKAGDCFSWQYHKLPIGDDSEDRQPNEFVHRGRYVKFHNFEPGLEIYEMQFIDNKTGKIIKPVKISEYELKYKDLKTNKLYSSEEAEKEDIFSLNEKAIENNEDLRIVEVSVERKAEKALRLIDEADKTPSRISWYNSMYFDEIYHARTGLEQARILSTNDSNSIYETTHPPLGKVFMTLSIMLFGMTPFAWRFAGALSGVLMLPGIYLIARLFSKKRPSAILALVLMALDFMHYTQTRIATIDSFATLFIIWASYFMFRYIVIALKQGGLKGQIKELFLSGLFFSLACASKWTGFYAGLGLAIIFFTGFTSHIVRLKKEGELGKKEIKNALITLISCVFIFVVMPFFIYLISFYPVFKNSGGLSIKRVLEASENMLSYHAKPGFGMDHPFYSPWYAWPFSQKPMWYYSGKRFDGTSSSILAFGNPIVWGFGLISTIAVFIKTLFGFYKKEKTSSLFEAVDIRAFLIIISFMAQYLPWALVPRGTYIYHYFPSVPFIILATSYILDGLLIKNKKTGNIVFVSLIILSLVAFIIFFPYISGFRVSLKWFELGKWFPTLYY